MALGDQIADLAARMIYIETMGEGIQAQLERIESKVGTPPASKQTVDYRLLEACFWNIRNHRLIEAIKDVRTMTGCGLKEGKDIVEILYYHMKED